LLPEINNIIHKTLRGKFAINQKELILRITLLEKGIGKR
jgi:hypothetical protein